jgi:hypothetical protein
MSQVTAVVQSQRFVIPSAKPNAHFQSDIPPCLKEYATEVAWARFASAANLALWEKQKGESMNLACCVCALGFTCPLNVGVSAVYLRNTAKAKIQVAADELSQLLGTGQATVKVSYEDCCDEECGDTWKVTFTYPDKPCLLTTPDQATMPTLLGETIQADDQKKKEAAASLGAAATPTDVKLEQMQEEVKHKES